MDDEYRLGLQKSCAKTILQLHEIAVRSMAIFIRGRENGMSPKERYGQWEEEIHKEVPGEQNSYMDKVM